MTDDERNLEVSPWPLLNAQRHLPRHHKKCTALAIGLAMFVTCLLLFVSRPTGASVPAAGLCPADVDRDGRVGGRDMAFLAQAWLAVPGDERWDAALDLNGDLVVGSEDQAIVASLWLAEDCDAAAVPPPTVWTGTAEFHASFCPGGELFFEAYDAQSPNGQPLYRIPLVPEECLRAPVPGPAVYGCEVGGRVVNAFTVEPLSGEHVSEEGYHVCNEQPPAET